MKLASMKIRATGATTIGARLDGAFVDLHAATDGRLPARMIDFLETGDQGMQLARSVLESSRRTPIGTRRSNCSHRSRGRARSCTPRATSTPTCPS